MKRVTVAHEHVTGDDGPTSVYRLYVAGVGSVQELPGPFFTRLGLRDDAEEVAEGVAGALRVGVEFREA